MHVLEVVKLQTYCVWRHVLEHTKRMYKSALVSLDVRMVVLVINTLVRLQQQVLRILLQRLQLLQKLKFLF